MSNSRFQMSHVGRIAKKKEKRGILWEQWSSDSICLILYSSRCGMSDIKCNLCQLSARYQMSYILYHMSDVRCQMSDVSCEFSPRRREEVETVSHHWLLSIQVVWRIMGSTGKDKSLGYGKSCQQKA